ncbi:uncharacterized protein LOC126317522 [Schistocerca gregaria]|uniref:uncharacterized protein LOC126317522 n=1 Tax=Schistocerca gregaria TaxID=7010 RepID=UPI00211DAC14|nr:uncharacterized protein LOC126317522 [Schistocerca gregaria]
MAAEGPAGKREKLILDLHDIGGVKFGEYKLKTGVTSPIYVDVRCIVGYPELMVRLIDCMWEAFQERNSEAMKRLPLIAGVPYTALPITSGMSIKYGWRMVMVRKEKKAYGTGREVEGVYRQGEGCLIVEDVVTSGSSILETREKLERDGLRCEHALVLIDREQGGSSNLASRGIKLTSVLNMSEMLSTLKKYGRISEEVERETLDYLGRHPSNLNGRFLNGLKSKVADSPRLRFAMRADMTDCEFNKNLFQLMERKKSNLCVAMDVTSKSEFLRLTELLAPEICLLKLHVDTIDDFDFDFVHRLQDLSLEHQFFIFEDRKFADIAQVVRRQYAHGVHKICTWAHLVDSHLISGASSVKALAEAASGCPKQRAEDSRAIVLITQMSTADALTRSEVDLFGASMQAARDMPSSISGFVCQKKFYQDAHGLICYVPGVHLSSESDGGGQCYRTPESAVESGADVIIVGRGILESPDPVAAAKMYRSRCWDAYLRAI